MKIHEESYLYTDELKQLLSYDELEEYNQNDSSLIDFGFEHIELGDYNQAYDLFMINLKLHGYSTEALNGLAISLLKLNNIKAAKTVLKKTLKLYPDDAITLANLAGLYWECNNPPKSLYYYTKSLNSNNSIIDTYFNIINLYYETGELFMAYLNCLKLLERFPGNMQAEQLSHEILFEIGISTF